MAFRFRDAARLLVLLTVAIVAMGAADLAKAQRRPVLEQIDLPHLYYFREMYLPQ